MKRKIYTLYVVLLALMLIVPMKVMPASAQIMQTPLPGNKIPQFVDPLPVLSVAGGTIQTVVAGADEIGLHMREFKANMLPTGTFAPGLKPETWVWGYIVGPSAPTTAQDTYIGPVIVATRGTPTQVRYVNNLGSAATTKVLAYKNSTDQSIHWANPGNVPMMNLTPPPIGNPAHYDGPIPAVTHLHGGEVPPVLDGGPDAWFLSQAQTGYTTQGPDYYTHPTIPAAVNESVYRYPNTQEAAPIWFHDHTLGATRLNVYMGLAGAYPIIDPGLALPTGLHPVGLQQGAGGTVEYLTPLVIQDRMFDTTGQLYFPNVGINSEHPYWIPEFVGDTIAVNGKVWPYHNVDRKRYRFLFLNGSNARAYDMFLIDPVSGIRGPRMWVIGTDGGYLDTPVLIDPNTTNKAVLKSLVMMPGERYDVIIDFNDPVWQGLLAAQGLAGQPINLVLRNTARMPFPGGAPSPVSTTGTIMQFRVSANSPVDNSYDPALGGALRTPMVRLTDPTTGTLVPGVIVDKTRQLTLNEVMGPGGPLEVLANNTKYGAAITEMPGEGKTEVWDVINLTEDAHPIHAHLTQFQIVYRWDFDAKGYNATYNAAFPGRVYIPSSGPPLDYNTPNAAGAIGGNPDITPFLSKKGKILPAPNEVGWKDTAQMFPGQVTRIVVRYAPTDKPITDPAMYYPFDPNALGRDYVWHCHIVDHEDNEMMRPYEVTPDLTATRSYIQGLDY